MSAATETAELEALAAENELDDDEAAALREYAGEGATALEALARVLAEREEEQAARADQEQPPAVLGEPTTEQLRRLDKELQRHEKRVHEIMGPFVAGFDACDKCGGVGLVAPGPQPQPHEWFIACDTCSGFGLVLTGSLREGQTARDCPTCRGRGYLEKLREDGQPYAAGAGTDTPPPPQPPPIALEQPPPSSNGASSGPSYGVPSWMGDPALGQ